MTFLEKAMEINDHIADEETLITGACPFHFGLEEEPDCTSTGGKKCIDCWNREMPSTEAKEDASLKDYKDFTDDLLNQGYTKGLTDAWELARKVIDLDYIERGLVFDSAVPLSPIDVIKIFTPQEAIAKLKAYEEAQNEIKVGDVVTYSGEKCLVLDTKGDKVVVLTSDCCVLEWHKCDVEKTGKHIDIQSILESIGE